MKHMGRRKKNRRSATVDQTGATPASVTSSSNADRLSKFFHRRIQQ